METVFLLWYIDATADGHDEKLIGVYRGQSDAEAAIERLRTKPGFGNKSPGFQISPYELNRDHWTEGFVSA